MPKPVLAVVDDLFFQAKIGGAALGFGIPARYAKTFADVERLTGADMPALLLVDLNLAGADALDIVRQIKSHDALKAVPLVAYLSHVQTDLKRAAEEAGCDAVWPRSKFSAELAELLLKHCAG